jgi:hypothetical protein
MPKKQTKAKASKNQQKERELNVCQRLFCLLSANNYATFGNATLSYVEAYAYKLEGLSKEKPFDKKTGKYLDSEYDKLYNQASAEASRLIRNPKVKEEINRLLALQISDERVDLELFKTIAQDTKLEAKVSAIREYNKLKKRVDEKPNVTVQVSLKSLFNELNE